MYKIDWIAKFFLGTCLALCSVNDSLAQGQFYPRGQVPPTSRPAKHLSQASTQKTNSAVSPDLLKVYEATKSAKSLAAVSSIASACEKVYGDRNRSKTDREYARSLFAWALNRRGEIQSDKAAELAGQGDLDQADKMDRAAAEDFERAIAFAPDNWRAHHNYGIALAMQNVFRGAILEFTKSIELKPNYANSYFNRGEIYFELENYSAAVDDYSKAISITPSDPQYYNSRAHSRFMLEQYEVALNDYQKAADMATDSATYQTDLADAYQYMGDWEKAARAYQVAVAIDNKHSRAYQNAAWLMATCPEAKYRNPSLALAAAKKAIELDGEKTSATLDTLAAATAASGNHPKAAEIQQMAVRMAVIDSEKQELNQRLSLYQKGVEYRQPRPLTSVANVSAPTGVPTPAGNIRTASGGQTSSR